MLHLFLKNNPFKNNPLKNNPFKTKNKTIENFYETRDFVIKNVKPKIKEFKNYYESEAFKEYKPNLKK